MIPPKPHAEGAAPAPVAPAAPTPSEPRSDTPVALSTHDSAPVDKAAALDDERSEPSATSATDALGTGKDDEERAKRPFSNTRADSPQAKGERARQNAPLRVSVPPRESGNSLSRWLMVSLVIAALIMGIQWYRQSHAQKSPAEVAERTPTAAAPTDTPRATPLAPSAIAVPQVAETASASAAVPTPDAPPAEANAAPAPEASAPPATSAAEPNAAAPSASSTAPEGTRVVIVKISPPNARLFYKGKPVGSSPVTLELAPGEKRKFEVGMPGWVTRRLVVDGSKPEVFIGLKPEQ